MEEVINKLIALTKQKNPQERIDGFWFEAPKIDLEALAQLMLLNQFRLNTMTGIEREDGETDVIYHFTGIKMAINIRTTTIQQKLPSIANILPSANWIEREIRDLYAVHFEGHPDPRPLVRPKEMPEGFFRKGVVESLTKEQEAK
jgi:NADH-quinone oxidoreductase subunit C